MADTFAVKCDHPYYPGATLQKLTRFYGPFPTESAADSHIAIEKALNLCSGNHTIIRIREVETERNLSNWQVNSIIESAKAQAVIEMARRAGPFAAVSTGERNETVKIVDNLSGTAGKIATIKELRNRYPGLGLKNAKDIVDEWDATGQVTFLRS